MRYTYNINEFTDNGIGALPEQAMSGIVLRSSLKPGVGAEALRLEYNQPHVKTAIHAIIEPNHVLETIRTTNKKRAAKRARFLGAGRIASWDARRIGIMLVEPDTISYNKKGRIVDADQGDTLFFMQEMLQDAADYCAMLCVFHGWQPEVINTAHNAGVLGFGHPARDPDHLFKWVGYSIEQFRDDVRKAMDFVGEPSDEELEEARLAEEAAALITAEREAAAAKAKAAAEAEAAEKKAKIDAEIEAAKAELEAAKVEQPPAEEKPKMVIIQQKPKE